MSKLPDSQQAIAPGYHPDLDEGAYRSDPGLGSTEIRKANRSIAELAHYQQEGIDQTSAMALGTAVHAAVLEPGRFESEYIDTPEPPVDLGDMYWRHRDTAELMAEGHDAPYIADEIGVQQDTVVGYMDDESDVQALYEFLRAHPDYDPDSQLDNDTLDKVRRIRDAVLDHPIVSGGLLDGGASEASVIWQQKAGRDTVRGKGRLDFVTQSGGQFRIVDLKTTGRTAQPEAYARTIGRRNLHMQAAWYTMGADAVLDLEPGHFIFLVVETDPPHHVKPILLGEQSIEAGVRRCREACHAIAEHRNNPDIYPGYEPKIRQVELKDWEM